MDSIFEYKDNFALYAHVKSKLILGGDFFEDAVVSIMIPTYKRPELLRETIESALKQSYDKNYHVIVVDNDDSGEFWNAVEALIQSFDAPNLYLFRNEQNIEMFGNWNRCIELSPTDKITILNDDDLLDIDFLQVVTKFYNTNEMIAVKTRMFGNIPLMLKKNYFIRSIKKVIEFFKFSNSLYKLRFFDVFWANPVTASLGVVFDKSVAIQVGGYDLDMYPSADYAFTVKYWHANKVFLIDKVLANYRWQENESLKKETLLGFCEKDYIIRSELINTLGNIVYKRIFYFISNVLNVYRLKLFSN